MTEAKKIESIIKASELYEKIEVIQDCLSHFEELDYIGIWEKGISKSIE